MTIQYFSDYQPPAQQPHRQAVVSLESERGEIVLRPNRFTLGYKLGEDADGFGQADVENELTPRLGRRGAMLGEQRELEGQMVLPVIISSNSNTEVDRLASMLGEVLSPADGTSRLILADPETGVGRYREVAYKSGLLTPAWSSPTMKKFDVTVDFMDPWAYSTIEEQVPIPVAPGASGGMQVPVRFPIRFARSGGAVDRWGTNHGEHPSPVTLRFDGPAENPEVTLQGYWTFRVNGTLAYDEYLMVDPVAGTVYVYSTTGAGRRAAPSMIRPSSRFTDLIIPPGQHTFTFRAIDPTYTASATASWQHAYRSMQ